jgi:hypothetical protein
MSWDLLSWIKVLLGSHAIQELGGDLPGVNSPPVGASSATSAFTVKVRYWYPHGY